MRLQIFSVLHGLTFDYPNDGFFLVDWLIVQRAEQLKNLFGGIENAVGALEMDFINSKPIMYLFKEVEDFEFAGKGDIYTEYMQGVLLAFWLVKDNNVCSDNAYYIFPSSNKSSNLGRLRTQYKYAASGDNYVAHFTEQEIITVRSLVTALLYCRSIDKAKYAHVTAVAANVWPLDVQYVPEIYSKLYRAITHLETLRETIHLSRKVFHYIAILECLFTRNKVDKQPVINTEQLDIAGIDTDSKQMLQPQEERSESITGMVRQRVNAYLGGSHREKKERAKNITVAYDIRSKYVHGQMALSKLNTKETQIKYSKLMDELVRTIFLLILRGDIEIFDLNDDDFETYIAHKIASQ